MENVPIVELSEDPRIIAEAAKSDEACNPNIGRQSSNGRALARSVYVDRILAAITVTSNFSKSVIRAMSRGVIPIWVSRRGSCDYCDTVSYER